MSAQQVVLPVRLGMPLRVQADTARFDGRIEYVSPDTLMLALPDGRPREVTTSGVARVWVRGTAWRTGMVTGGLMGLVAGGALAFLGCSFGAALSDGSQSNDETMRCIALGTALSTGAGALLGGAIGAVIPKWHLRYRRDGGATLSFRLVV